MRIRFITTFVALIAAGGLAACDDDTPAEEALEEAEDVLEEAPDVVPVPVPVPVDTTLPVDTTMPDTMGVMPPGDTVSGRG